MNMDIACIPNLSVRSTNCLHRRGWNTVGDIINNISSIEDIRQIRNCGKNSSEEIFEQILNLQKSMIPVTDQPIYERIFEHVNRGDPGDGASGSSFAEPEKPRCWNASSGAGSANLWNTRIGEGRDIICKILQM